MSNYTVGTGGDFATIAAALKAVKPGDVVDILPGVYKEKLQIDTPDTTWRAANYDNRPVIDGGWNGKSDGQGFAALVQINAPGVTLDRLIIRNSTGRGLFVAASGATIRRCWVDMTWQGAFLAGDSGGKPIRGVLVADCEFSNMSQSIFIAGFGSGGGGGVNVGVNFLNVTHSVIRDCIVRHGGGEGINVGRGSLWVTVSGNTIYSLNHVELYGNRCSDCLFDSNFIFHVEDKKYRSKDGQYSAGIVIGDEGGEKVSQFPHSRGNVVTNNIVVNAGQLLHVRNNASNYDTQLLDTVIKNNTFVAGPLTRDGIKISANLHGRPHKNSHFRNNVIHTEDAPKDANIASFGGGGVQFGGNVWSEQPAANMRGDGDIYADPQLVNPVMIASPAEFDRDNYRAVAGGPAAALGAGALPPLGDPPIDPPPPPPPEPEPEPGLDVAALVALVDAAAARLDTAEGEIALAAATLVRASQSLAAAAHEIEELRRMLAEQVTHD